MGRNVVYSVVQELNFVNRCDIDIEFIKIV